MHFAENGVCYFPKHSYFFSAPLFSRKRTHFCSVNSHFFGPADCLSLANICDWKVRVHIWIKICQILIKYITAVFQTNIFAGEFPTGKKGSGEMLVVSLAWNCGDPALFPKPQGRKVIAFPIFHPQKNYVPNISFALKTQLYFNNDFF